MGQIMLDMLPSWRETIYKLKGYTHFNAICDCLGLFTQTLIYNRVRPDMLNVAG